MADVQPDEDVVVARGRRSVNSGRSDHRRVLTHKYSPSSTKVQSVGHDLNHNQHLTLPHQLRPNIQSPGIIPHRDTRRHHKTNPHLPRLQHVPARVAIQRHVARIHKLGARVAPQVMIRHPALPSQQRNLPRPLRDSKQFKQRRIADLAFGSRRQERSHKLFELLVVFVQSIVPVLLPLGVFDHGLDELSLTIDHSLALVGFAVVYRARAGGGFVEPSRQGSHLLVDLGRVADPALACKHGGDDVLHEQALDEVGARDVVADEVRDVRLADLAAAAGVDHVGHVEEERRGVFAQAGLAVGHRVGKVFVREIADETRQQVRELLGEAALLGLGAGPVVFVRAARLGDEDGGRRADGVVAATAAAAAAAAASAGAARDRAAPFGNYALGAFAVTGAVAAAGTKFTLDVGHGEVGDGTRDGAAAMMAAAGHVVIVAAARRAIGRVDHALGGLPVARAGGSGGGRGVGDGGVGRGRAGEHLQGQGLFLGVFADLHPEVTLAGELFLESLQFVSYGPHRCIGVLTYLDNRLVFLLLRRHVSLKLVHPSPLSPDLLTLSFKLGTSSLIIHSIRLRRVHVA